MDKVILWYIVQGIYIKEVLPHKSTDIIIKYIKLIYKRLLPFVQTYYRFLLSWKRSLDSFFVVVIHYTWFRRSIENHWLINLNHWWQFWSPTSYHSRWVSSLSRPSGLSPIHGCGVKLTNSLLVSPDSTLPEIIHLLSLLLYSLFKYPNKFPMVVGIKLLSLQIWTLNYIKGRGCMKWLIVFVGGGVLGTSRQGRQVRTFSVPVTNRVDPVRKKWR